VASFDLASGIVLVHHFYLNVIWKTPLVCSWSTAVCHLGRRLWYNVSYLVDSHLVESFCIQFGMLFGNRFFILQ